MNKKKSKNFVNARLRHIVDRPPPDYPLSIPFYRGEHVFKSFDFGEGETAVDLFRTNHICCYIVVIDGELWSYKAGMNKIHAEIDAMIIRFDKKVDVLNLHKDDVIHLAQRLGLVVSEKSGSG